MKVSTCIPEFPYRLLLAAFGLFLLALPLNGAAYIKFDGIDGEAKDKDHDKWIDVLSFEWGMEQEVDAATGGGGGAGKVKFDKLTIKKHIDKATPLLMRACATGEPIPTMTMDLTRANSTGGEAKYLVITMTDVLITSVRTGGSTDDTVPAETVTLNFTTVEFAYSPENADGTLGEPVIFTWNLATNTE